MFWYIVAIFLIVTTVGQKVWECLYVRRTGNDPKTLWETPTTPAPPALPPSSPRPVLPANVAHAAQLAQIAQALQKESKHWKEVAPCAEEEPEPHESEEQILCRETAEFKRAHPVRFFLVCGGMPGFAGVSPDFYTRVRFAVTSGVLRDYERREANRK